MLLGEKHPSAVVEVTKTAMEILAVRVVVMTLTEGNIESINIPLGNLLHVLAADLLNLLAV